MKKQYEVTLNKNLEQDGGHPATGQAERKVPSYQRVSSKFQSGPLYRTLSDALDKGGGGGEVLPGSSEASTNRNYFTIDKLRKIELHILCSFHDDDSF
jgi:hypothetical protein